MSKSWAGGSTRRWRRVRARVLRLDLPLHLRPRCAIRLPCCTTTATQAHHIHGKSSACPGCRADHPTHLTPACSSCNLAVGDPTKGSKPKPHKITRW